MNMLLQKIEDQITELTNKKKIIEKLVEKYWDIAEYTDRWESKRFSTRMVNTEVDCVMMKHNCGCCDDSPLEAWPYKLVEGTEVYSNPAFFFIGEKNNDGTGDKPYDNWQEKLRKENITEYVIGKIQEYLDANPPIDIEDEWDEDSFTYHD